VVQGNVFVWALIQTFDQTRLLPVTQFNAHKEYITRILLSPDVKKLATCSADHTAKIWEVTEVEPSTAASFPASDGNSPKPPTANGAAHTNGSSNGVSMGLGMSMGMGGGSSILLSPNNGVMGGGQPAADQPKPYPLEATLQGHQRWVWDCAFSADSAYLVTACSDHYARLWELHSQQVIRQYNGHHRGAVCVALNDYSETR
jgi:target of rapamycin complex subunit LST8